MKTIQITGADIRNAEGPDLTGTELSEVNKLLFFALVPTTGKAPTSAGEKLRQANMRLMRYINDGDMTGQWRIDRINTFSDAELTAYFWRYLALVVDEVAKSRAGKQVLAANGITYRYIRF